MNKEIREISDDGKILQVTTWDERWYMQIEKDKTGKRIISKKEYPSVTWITDYYPKGIAFMKWYANKGWDEAEAIKASAGNKGSKVHLAISSMLLDNGLKIDDKFPNKDGEQEELTLEEWECLMSFVEWFEETKPEPEENEKTLFNDEHNYAGTADFICTINDERWLIDFKTSANIWPSHELQVSAYNHALDKPCDKMAILQLGYKRNKTKKWKFTEVNDKFELFLAAKKIWENECANVSVFQKDYPTSLTLSK